MVWGWGPVVWIFEIPEHERDSYLWGSLESQTTNPNHQFAIRWFFRPKKKQFEIKSYVWIAKWAPSPVVSTVKIQLHGWNKPSCPSIRPFIGVIVSFMIIVGAQIFSVFWDGWVPIVFCRVWEFEPRMPFPWVFQGMISRISYFFYLVSKLLKAKG